MQICVLKSQLWPPDQNSSKNKNKHFLLNSDEIKFMFYFLLSHIPSVSKYCDHEKYRPRYIDECTDFQPT